MRGATGCAPGFSGQHSEGAEAFHAAALELLSPEARAQTRYLFSDSPSEGLRSAFPNSVGIAEDLLHLVIRCEYCTGGHRTECTVRLLALQKKFALPASGDLTVYRGESAASSATWENTSAQAPLADHEVDRYLAKPFESHREYIAALKRLAADYPEATRRRNDKNATVLQLIKNGSGARHFGYLRNHSVFRALHEGPLPMGTTGNEALHMQLKAWTRCVYKQHRLRLVIVAAVFGLYKMLGYAARRAGLTRAIREGKAAAIICGTMQRPGNATAGAPPPDGPTSRAELKRPRLRLSGEQLQTKAARKQSRATQWQKHLEEREERERAKNRAQAKKKTNVDTKPRKKQGARATQQAAKKHTRKTATQTKPKGKDRKHQ